MHISEADYREFAELLERVSGIVLGEGKEYLVASRLVRELPALGCPDFHALLVLLREGRPRVIEVILDAMTTNETNWFRDIYPFDVLTDPILASHFKGRATRIWSAACSTGEEPYSIAMAIDEARLAKPGIQVPREIVATDISQRALDKARSGVYDETSLRRGMSPERLRRYFQAREDGLWQVIERIRSQVRFMRHNLQDSLVPLGKFDVVFCRNVLIYFSRENKQRLIKRLASAINAGGFLVLGASESIGDDHEQFEMIRCQPGIVYRKK
jgi:chemotaxis protein methyltransferase CheR